MNFELLRCGYLPVLIQVEQPLTYDDTLDTAHTTQQYEPFIQLVAEQERKTLTRYLSVIQGEWVVGLRFANPAYGLRYPARVLR